MMPQPDKLFRDRLEHFKKSPPPQAWNRVNSGLYTRKSKSLWISIAAGIAILLGASFLFWKAHEPPKELASITIGKVVQPAQENQPEISATSLISEPAPTLITPTAKRNNTQTGNINIAQSTIETAHLPEEHTEEASIAGMAEAIEISSSPASEPMAVNDVQSSNSRSNKIIYSTNEVNSRFLKKDSAPMASSSPSAPSTEKVEAETPIQRILDIASGLKNEDASLSDLREIKNEYLSIPIKTQAKDK